ncbi:MAG TPA: GNAT family N-acetyltransferase [Phenylobacterium sp.]|uniref:GNAT family N-acetyltransferase n=1 Tax=Phenylobacterium conjunctum TaxID=1298959 RepID=A0ABW3T4S1_9CAUL|nr:GNAT family N-acetyltransferase [Phenylobacterium sp.]HQN50105.1 GNAT family N-acetyltransferase [Phenylobacterium sp.]
MEIEVLRPQDLSPARMERWRELQASDIRLDSPFLSPQWARAVERAQGEGARHVRVAVLRQDGRDVGYFAARAGSVTAMPAGAPMCDYQGLVAEPGVKIDARELVEALGVNRFDFCHMLAEDQSFAPHARGQVTSHVVDVGQGYAAYEAARRAAGTSVLKDCDKKRRKVEREVGEARFTAFSRSRADFDSLVAWKRAQLHATGQTDLFETGWTMRLLRDLFASRDPDFGATLFTLHFGERLAAVHLHLRGRRTVHGWLIAHDPEFERYSPGILLFQDILRWMDQTPYSRLDLGPGDYRFKRELANLGQDVTFGFVGRPSAAAFIRTAAYGVRAAAEALPLGRVSELPGKAMRRLDTIRGLR